MLSAALSSAAAHYKSGKDAKYAGAKLELEDDDDEKDYGGGEEGLSISATSFMAGGRQSAFPGGPFSAVTHSMCPQDILVQLQKVEETHHQPEYRFDEFGFKIEVEDGPEESSSKILSVPFVEDPQHRLKWIAHLEFTHNQVVEDLTWSKIEPLLPRSDKLKSMVRSGVPNSLRPFIWPRLCGSNLKKQQATFSYKEILKHANSDKLLNSKHIEKDLLRTMPHNACFMMLQSTGVPRLRRILRAIGYLYPEIGYCQGMGIIVCSLLLVMEEEPVFWMMVCLIEDLVPASYFSNSLIGVQADQLVLQQLVGSFLPQVDAVLLKNDIELALISLHWFLTAFSSVVHMKILVRIWDVFFYEGSIALFQLALGLLKMRESDLVKCDNSAQLFNILSDLPGSVEDADYWLDAALNVAPALSDAILATHRKKHLAYLMAEQGVLVNPEAESNLPKQKVQRRKLRRSQSVIGQLFHIGATATALDDLKMKNVRQTELLVDLKNSILKVARHFLAGEGGDCGSLGGSRSSEKSSSTATCKVAKSLPVSRRRSSSNSASSAHGGGCSLHLQVPKASSLLTADYSLESHAKDHEQFIAVHQSHRRRARALLDFERHDEDELGFRKNDVIDIISQKDEHCWIGELNGLRGWFPAKFVEVLDERSKDYCALGDDAVCPLITDLVRGTFCPCLKAVFEHGIKRTPIAGSPTHPWLFVEEVAKQEVKKDFDSVYSRLVLCRTYKLDQDGKVLTPEELLYKAVQAVNVSHDGKNAQMDVKLRSLICMGLNEQVLHLWFELLCSSNDIVRKWYNRWSFIRSPCWVQIKCEIRILSQFAFSLNPNWELGDVVKEIQKPLKEGVRDMLVKHHLFSWDL